MTDNITTLEELKSAISALKLEKAASKEQLKTEFLVVLEKIKPANLLKKGFKEVATSPNLIENLIGAALGIASGFVSKKIFVMGSGNIFRKFFGTIMQLGVTRLVAKKTHDLKLIGQAVFKRLITRKSETSETLPNAIVHEDYTLIKTTK